MAIIFWILNFFDWATTLLAVQQFGTSVELNPEMRRLIEESLLNFTAVKLLGILPFQLFFWASVQFASKGGENNAFYAKKLYKGVYTVIIAIYLFGVINNLMVLY